MDEAAERLAGRTVLEVELHFDDLEAGAQGVDGHPRFHAEARSERQQLGKHARAHGALTGDRSGHHPPGGALDGAPRAADGDPKATARATREGRDREISTPSFTWSRVERLNV